MNRKQKIKSMEFTGKIDDQVVYFDDITSSDCSKR